MRDCELPRRLLSITYVLLPLGMLDFGLCRCVIGYSFRSGLWNDGNPLTHRVFSIKTLLDNIPRKATSGLHTLPPEHSEVVRPPIGPRPVKSYHTQKGREQWKQ